MSANPMYDEMFYDRAVWYLNFAWRPRRCDRSGAIIWLTRAYRGTVMWFGPGEPIMEHRWLTKDQYILGKLRGNL